MAFRIWLSVESIVRVGAVLAAFAASGCAAESIAEKTATQTDERPMAVQAQSLKKFSVAPPISDFGERARTLASVLFGHDDVQLPSETGEGFDGSVLWMDVANVPAVFVRYSAAMDDLQVRNVALETDYEYLMSFPFLSEGEAREELIPVLAQLEAAGLIEMSEWDLEDVTVGTHEYGEASSNDVGPNLEIVGYRFIVRRRLGGLQLRNALVRVSITRSREISSIRVLRGAVALIEGDDSLRMVDDAECLARFQREFPSSVIKRQGVGYFLPRELEQKSELEPMCYFSFVGQSTIDGQTAYSRRLDVRYSLLRENAERVLLGGPESPKGRGSQVELSLDDDGTVGAAESD